MCNQFVVLLAFAMIVYLLYSKMNTYEHWQNYIQKPYNYMKSGSEPMNMYRYDRYRKPYRYPFKFHSSYPYPHLTHHE